MPRMPRMVVPGLAHHVTQRGVRSLAVFTGRGDREMYLGLLREQAERWGLRFLAWCLMTNPVHLVVVPRTEDALERRVATGRPWAPERFIDGLERETGRVLRAGNGDWPKGRRRKR